MLFFEDRLGEDPTKQAAVAQGTETVGRQIEEELQLNVAGYVLDKLRSSGVIVKDWTNGVIQQGPVWL